jgi:hypothetical protein
VVLLPADGLPEFDLFRRWLLKVGKWAGLEFTAGDDMSASDFSAITEFIPMYAVSCGFTEAGQPSKAVPDAERSMRQFLTPTVMQALIRFPIWWAETRDNRMTLFLSRGIRSPA